jgi:hypothetical protein
METKKIRDELEFWATGCPEAPAGIKSKAALLELATLEREVEHLTAAEARANAAFQAAEAARLKAEGATQESRDAVLEAAACHVFDVLVGQDPHHTARDVSELIRALKSQPAARFVPESGLVKVLRAARDADRQNEGVGIAKQDMLLAADGAGGAQTVESIAAVLGLSLD